MSEDLDELMAISDRIAVIYRGQLSEALPTASRSVAEIGLLMSTTRRVEAGPGGVLDAD
jgi:simple sugar transport system ATP-binding protein